jgi:hypothetical protein
VCKINEQNKQCWMKLTHLSSAPSILDNFVWSILWPLFDHNIYGIYAPEMRFTFLMCVKSMSKINNVEWKLLQLQITQTMYPLRMCEKYEKVPHINLSEKIRVLGA